MSQFFRHLLSLPLGSLLKEVNMRQKGFEIMTYRAFRMFKQELRFPY